MKTTLRLLLLGLLTWLVPFFMAFFFVDQKGEITIDIFFFKTIMIIVGAITGAIAINLFFRKVEKSYLKLGFLTGFSWFVLNIILDFSTLLQMSEMSYSQYFQQIGLRYFNILIICVLVGYVLSEKHEKIEQLQLKK